MLDMSTPRPLRIIFRAFLFVFLFVFGLSDTLSAAPVSRRDPVAVSASPATSSLAFFSPAGNMISDILLYVNLHRRQIGLKPLLMNSFESSVAAQHSHNMATGRTPFGHKGFEDRVRTIGKRLGFISLAAENVASGQMSAREVVDGWLHSPGHRRNIEGDFRLTGIGLARGRNGRIYYTQIFTR